MRVAIGDLNGSGHLDLAVANLSSDNVSVLINTGGGIEGTVSVELTCSPSFGTLPFVTNMTVSLTNTSTEYGRRFAGHLDLMTAGGMTILNWKSDWINIGPGGYATTILTRTTPEKPTFIGMNTAELVAEDVTPAPYNQPPYPPSGWTDTDSCEVEGISP